MDDSEVKETAFPEANVRKKIETIWPMWQQGYAGQRMQC
jgi:hypothetical protein